MKNAFGSFDMKKKNMNIFGYMYMQTYYIFMYMKT